MRIRKVCFVFSICVVGSLFAADGVWTNTTGGIWSSADNWLNGAVADGSGSTAWFTNTAAGVVGVNNDASRSLQAIKLGGSGYALSGATITNDGGGRIDTFAGDHALLLPLSLSGTTTVTVATNQTLTVGGGVSGNGQLILANGRMVLTNANTYAGGTRHITGILEFNSPQALGGSSDDSANLVLGEGIFRYTGPSATLTRGYTMVPGVSSNRAVVIDVTNATTTLTIAGKVVAPGGAFIKTGDGTLVYTYPGYQELNKSKLSNKENGAITYDANGVAATNEYALFTVERGQLILGAPGQTNIVNASSGWVGCKTLASPRLSIIGGVTRFLGGYFTIGRGTGVTNSIQSPSVFINGGSYVTIEGSGLVMDNANGQVGHRCRPVLNISNATLRVSNDCFLSEDGSATTVVSVANSGWFISDSLNPIRGMGISQSAGSKTDVTIDGNSTGTVYQLRVGSGGTLNVTGGSVFEMDGTPTNVVYDKSNAGTVRFNGGLLKQRTSQRSSDWFVRLASLLVGANNMTVDVASHAWLDATAQADPLSSGGKIIKTGVGALALRNTGLNVQVNGGSLSMRLDHAYLTNGLSGTITMGSGTSMEVAGANALADMTVTPGTQPFVFTPHSLSSKPDLWSCNGYGMRRWDGMLRLTPDIGGSVGSSFMFRKFKVDGPWTANFAFITWSTGSTPADGFSFVLHNDPRGAYAIGSGSANLGYIGTPCVTNSVAVGIDIYNRRIRFGKQGNFLVNTANYTLANFAATPVKMYFKVNYDGAGLLTATITRSDLPSYQFTYPVNIATEVGGSAAYIGFTAGTGGAQGQHSVSDFTFDNGSAAPVAYCRYGGKTSLASGETMTASLQPSAQQNGFVFGRLAYGDQSVVNISAPATTNAMPLPSLADQNLWKLNGAAHWKTNGGLAVSTNAVNQPQGSAYMTNRYSIAGSWVANFGYDIGQTNSTPADYLTFQLQNSGLGNTSEVPNPGLSVMWRFYDGNIRTTQIKIYTNGALLSVVSTNIVPVDLKNGNHAHMTVAYDAVNTRLTITTVQDNMGTNVTSLGGFNLSTILNGLSSVYVGFNGATGGSYSENIISDFSFLSDGMVTSATKAGYLAFDRLSGSGTLIKRGTGALALMGDRDSSTSNTVLRLESGGLVLRKTSLEALDLTGARSDWVFSSLGQWGEDGTLQVCPNLASSCGVGGSTRRVCVSNAWTATFSFLFGSASAQPADAFCMFLHNDPRGSGYASGTAVSAGYSGIAKSIGLRWCFYPWHPATYLYKVGIGRNGTWNDGSNQSYLPVVITNGLTTGFIIRYDPVAATLTSVMTQGVNTVTNVFTGVTIPTDVGDAYAYVGFGGGTGGAYGEMRIRDFSLTQDTPSDQLANQVYLANLILPDFSTNTVTLDASIANATFKIASATVGDGAAVNLATTLQNGTLVVSNATLSGDAAFAPAAGCTFALGTVTGGRSLAKSNAGSLVLSGPTLTYTGSTLLTAGTLSLDAPRLPTTTDLYVTNSATLNLAFTGKQVVHALTVNGVAMPGGRYTSAKASWITGTGALVVSYPPVGTLLFVQ